jgi:hypothetical protein
LPLRWGGPLPVATNLGCFVSQALAGPELFHTAGLAF